MTQRYGCMGLTALKGPRGPLDHRREKKILTRTPSRHLGALKPGRILSRDATIGAMWAADSVLPDRMREIIDMKSVRSIRRNELLGALAATAATIGTGAAGCGGTIDVGGGGPNVALAKKFARQLNSEFVAPQSELERTVGRIIAEVLDVGRVGAADNFFALGGDSLRATQVLARIRTVLDVNLSIATVFRKSTVAELADEIRRVRAETAADREG